MSKKTRRVVISLSNFLTDHRSTVLIYLSRKLRYIRDLEEHVGGLFGIADFYFTSGNRYLPSTEDIRILNPEELLKAIPKSSTRQDGPQLNKPNEEGVEPPAPQKALKTQEALPMMNELFSVSETNEKPKPLFGDVINSEELLPTHDGDAKPKRDSPLPSTSTALNAYLETPKSVCDQNETFRVEMGPSPGYLENPKMACDENKTFQVEMGPSPGYLETPKMACDENKTFQTEMGPSSFPVEPQTSNSNFESEAQGAPQSPSTAIVEHVFNFLERPEMAHGEDDANLHRTCERPRLDEMECETPSTPPELEGGVKCSTLKNAKAKGKKTKRSSKIESKVDKTIAEQNSTKQWKMSESEPRSISVLETYVLTRTWPHLDKTETSSKEKAAVTNKRAIAKEEGAQARHSFKTRPVTVKKRKTDLMCLKLPKQTNIVKSLIVSGTPKLLNSREVKPECQGAARKTTESQRKPETNQNASQTTNSQAQDSLRNPEYRSAISGATLQATGSRRKREEFQNPAVSHLTDGEWKLEVNRNPAGRAISATISRTIESRRKLETATAPRTTASQMKSEVKPECQSPICDAISAFALQTTDSRSKLEVNQGPAATISQTIDESQRKLETNHQTIEESQQRKLETNHGPACNAISEFALQTTASRLKLKVNQNPAATISQTIEKSQRKLETNHGPACSAISAITDGELDVKPEMKLEVKPEFENPVGSAVLQISNRQLKLEVKPEIPSPSVTAISDSSQQTTDGQWKLEVKPEFQSPLCKSHRTDNQTKPAFESLAATRATTPQGLVKAETSSTDQNQSATSKYSEVEPAETKQLQSVLDREEEKESTSSSALPSNSDSDRNSSENKRKRKRHRKRKDKGKAAPEPPVNTVHSFKPPSTIAAPSMHIRFDESDVHAEEAEPPPSNKTAAEGRQPETNGVVEEISDLEGEMLERVVRQSPRMTKTLPRAGDVVSFKFLRLNVNYEPEISKTIIGKVLDFTADTDQVHMHLISGVEHCQEPDGKFSLEDEDSAVITKKSFPWKSLLEPRLLFP